MNSNMHNNKKIDLGNSVYSGDLVLDNWLSINKCNLCQPIRSDNSIMKLTNNSECESFLTMLSIIKRDETDRNE